MSRSWYRGGGGTGAVRSGLDADEAGLGVSGSQGGGETGLKDSGGVAGGVRGPPFEFTVARMRLPEVR